MDKIFLTDLRIPTVIGIWDWERRIRQTVRVDLEIATDVRAAAADDSIDAALNYKDIAKQVIAFVEGAEFRLVETLAERIARIIIVEHGVEWVRVAVAKPGAIEGSREVGVVIERAAPDYA